MFRKLKRKKKDFDRDQKISPETETIKYESNQVKSLKREFSRDENSSKKKISVQKIRNVSSQNKFGKK